MNSTRLTIVLLVLIVLAAMWTSGRLTALANAIMGKEPASQPAGAGSAGSGSKTGGGSASGRAKYK
jgi:hypothetical protein